MAVKTSTVCVSAEAAAWPDKSAPLAKAGIISTATVRTMPDNQRAGTPNTMSKTSTSANLTAQPERFAVSLPSTLYAILIPEMDDSKRKTQIFSHPSLVWMV